MNVVETMNLHEVHDLIIQMQKLYDADIQDPTATPKELAKIQRAKAKLAKAINTFDCTFHDMFDCQ